MLPISFFPSNLSRYRLNKFKILFLSKIPLESFSLSPLFFFFILISSTIFTLFRFEFVDRCTITHPSEALSATMHRTIFYVPTIRVFFTV